ncbi:FAD-binding protein [Aeromicrobium sp. P5_D10]
MSETNWAGNVIYQSTTVHRPSSVEQLQELVAAAPSVRAIGSRHSFNTIADTRGIHVDTTALPDRFDLDENARTVTVPAGLQHGALVERLDRAGWALHNLASLPHISVAGAVSTGTHGSGDTNGSLATAVAGLQLVTSDGGCRDVSRGDEDFEAMVVSLGTLGVLTYLTLDIEPTFEIRQDVFEHLPWSAAEAHFDEITAAAYSVSMFTDWGDDVTSVWLKSRATKPRTDLFGAGPATRELHPLPDVDPGATTRQLGRPGPWWDRLPHFQLAFTPSHGEELQTEYLLPRQHAIDAIRAVRAMAQAVRPLLLVSEIRTVAGDDLWLSPSHSTDCVALHFTWRRDVPAVTALLPRLDDALAPFVARPHWGKLFATTPERLAAAYPQISRFRTLADRLDPAGTFRNELTDLWLGRDRST